MPHVLLFSCVQHDAASMLICLLLQPSCSDICTGYDRPHGPYHAYHVMGVWPIKQLAHPGATARDYAFLIF